MKQQRLVALFALGILLFNYPLLSLFSVDVIVLGFPVLYLYLFGGWLTFVWLVARVVESAEPTARPTSTAGTLPSSSTE